MRLGRSLSAVFFFLLASSLSEGAFELKGVYGGSDKLTGDVLPKTIAIGVGDVDRDGVFETTDTLTMDDLNPRHLFYLSHRPINKIIHVKIDTNLLDRRDGMAQANYSYDLKNGWISFRYIYDESNTVEVHYETSRDVDVFAGNNDGIGGQSPALYRKGSGLNYTFEELTSYAFDVNDVAVGDVNKDGHLDYLLATNSFPILGYNDGSGDIGSVVNFTGTPPSSYVELVDYDSDGDLDLYVSPSAAQRIVPTSGDADWGIIENYGDGSFQLTMNSGINFWGTPTQIKMGDMDGDGDLDLVKIKQNGGPGISVHQAIISTGPFLHTAWHSRVIRGYTEPGFGWAFFDMDSFEMNSISPKYIAMDEDYIYISETSSHRIQKRRLDNYDLVRQVSNGQGGNLNQFDHPHGIAVDNDYVYVADRNNNRVHRRF
ncbi:hypothetical protein BVX98_01935 [bacterium F11]|nr:hypothetical protein BVX98_01935 [bacterium F11]